MKLIEFNNTGLFVKVDQDSEGREDLWLEVDSISKFFEKDPSVIRKHISKIYKDGEVGKNSFRKTSKIYTEGKNKGSSYEVNEYNLSVILSVGYKVNGKRGNEFRIWANQILGQYLKQGYVVNEKVMLQKGMNEVVALLDSYQQHLLKGKKGRTKDFDDVMDIIKEYGYSFTTLQEYDEGKLVLEGKEMNTKYVLDYTSSIKAIEKFKKDLLKKGEATILFGQEKTPMSLGSILGNVFNVFSWGDAYPSLEEKASQLLYFIIKDHPFNDGNKRIAGFLFSLFLKKNDFHRKSNGELKINDNTLGLLAVMIAESAPSQRESFIKLLVNTLRSR